MNLILASDFPESAHPRIVERISATAERPRIAWIAADSADGRAHFAAAAQRFHALGFEDLEYCDIDEEKDDVQLAFLYEFDVVIIAEGDPLRFRYNMLRAGLSGRLRQAAASGRLIVACGGGSLLLTPNVSVWRLANEQLEEVLGNRSRYDGMGAVAYEVLPHANLRDAELLEKVRSYSERIDNDVLALADGSAIFPATERSFDYVGEVVRYRRGTCEAYTQRRG